MSKPNKLDDWYRDAARDLYHREGEIEVDDLAKVSRSDDHGAYVQAWVWVDGPVCAECRETITNARGVVQAKDGALFHGRCWRNDQK